MKFDRHPVGGAQLRGMDGLRGASVQRGKCRGISQRDAERRLPAAESDQPLRAGRVRGGGQARHGEARRQPNSGPDDPPAGDTEDMHLDHDFRARMQQVVNQHASHLGLPCGIAQDDRAPRCGRLESLDLEDLLRGLPDFGSLFGRQCAGKRNGRHRGGLEIGSLGRGVRSDEQEFAVHRHGERFADLAERSQGAGKIALGKVGAHRTAGVEFFLEQDFEAEFGCDLPVCRSDLAAEAKRRVVVGVGQSRRLRQPGLGRGGRVSCHWRSICRARQRLELPGVRGHLDRRAVFARRRE